MSLRLTASCLAVLTLVAGCGDSGTTATNDAATTTDVGSPSDTGAADVGTTTDTGARSDTGTTTDAGTPSDTGTTTDAGTPSDTGTATDTGTPSDTGTTTDVGTTTDAGAPSDTGTATDAGTATDVPAAPTCAAYCAAVTANCSGANRQFGATDAAAMTSCLSACAAFGWGAGALGDTSGNTLGCHLYHANAAASGAALHCPHAGPLGGGVCGTTPCADFCAADLAVCTGANAAYASMDACVTACTALTDHASATSPTATAGNTLSCRTYHLTAASASSSAAAMHCSHTAATSVVCN